MSLKYFSVDIETTGLDFEKNQVIEFGAIFEDTNTLVSFKNIPKFKRIIRHDSYVGSAIAINMNARIFKILADYDKIKSTTDRETFREFHGIISPEELMPQFKEFVIDCYEMYGVFVPNNGINIEFALNNSTEASYNNLPSEKEFDEWIDENVVQLSDGNIKITKRASITEWLKNRANSTSED